MSSAEDATLLDLTPRKSEAATMPEQVGNYRITGILGSGGGGTVYRGVSIEDGRQVAVKMLRRDFAVDVRMVTRFEREFRAISAIKHPNIVEIFEFGRMPNGQPYYVMEVIEGINLRRMIRSEPLLPPEEVLAIMEPICEAVAAAHKAGIVHRDLKSSNVIIRHVDGKISVKLLDFGVAKFLAPDPDERGLTRAGTMLGTSLTMAPEQVRGQAIDHRADIYALGVMLFETLTRTFPFFSDHQPEVLRMHLESPPPRPSKVAPVSPAFDGVVTRALEKRAEDRYQSVEEMLVALREAAGNVQREDDNDTPVVEVAAVYVEIGLEGIAESDQTGDVIDDIMAIQELAEDHFAGADLQVALATGTSLLALRRIESPEERASICEAVSTCADVLVAELAHRDGADPRIKVRVAAHCSTGIPTRGQVERVESGEIFNLVSWLPERYDERGLYLSAQLLHSVPSRAA